MTWVLIAQVTATPGSAGGTTAAIDTTGADLLLIHVSSGASLTATPSDSKSNSGWTGLTGVQQSRWYWCKPTSVGAGHTFAFSQNDSYPVINGYAFSGSHPTTPFGGHQNGIRNYVGGDPATTGSITPPEDNCLIVSGIGYAGAGSDPSCGPGFTIDEYRAAVGGVNVGGAAAYLIQGTAAAINASWTQTGDVTAGRTIAAFLPAASGGLSAAAKRRYRRTNLLFLPE